MIANNIVKKLLKTGNSLLGSGFYSTVVSTKSDNKVLKIGNNVKDAWLAYLAIIVEQSRHNVCTPTIYDLKMEDTYYVCTIEKLKPIEENSLTIYLHDSINDFIKGIYSDEDLLDILYVNEEYFPLPEHMLTLCKDLKKYTKYQNKKDIPQKP